MFKSPSLKSLETASSNLRSDSRHKWYILFVLSTLWIASYHVILCIGALEDSMMITFALSNKEFSLFATLSFLFAIFGSICCPKLIHKINLYNTMLVSASTVTFGQIVFIFGIIAPSTYNIYIMYLGRILIGFGYGIQNVTIYSTVNIWFQNNQWLSFALNTVNSTYEIGILTSRYCLVPLYELTNELYIPYLIGAALGFLSMISCIVMISIEKDFNKQHSILASSENTIDLDNDFSKIKQFNIKIWLIIIVIIIGWSSCETFGTQITDPFMVTFGIDEKDVNMLLSIQSICALTVAQIWGWFNSKYGYLSHFLILSMLLMSVGMLILFINMNMSELSSMWKVINMVSIIIIYVIGLQQFFAVSFTCLLLICPVELSSIVNSVAAIGYMVGSVIETDLFGVFADASKDSDNIYKWSVFMMISFTFIGMIIAIIIHYMDVLQNGPLHEKKKKPTVTAMNKQLVLPLQFLYIKAKVCS